MALKKLSLELWVILNIILFLLFLPLVLLLTALATLYRTAVWICAKCFRSDLDQILKAFSHLFCYDAVAPNCTFNICVTVVCEGDMSLKELRRKIEDNWILKRHPTSGKLVYPELQQSVSFFGGYPFWKWIPKFCLEDYVSLLELGNEHGETTTTTTPESVRDFQSGLMSKPWRENGALWEFLLLNNYFDSAYSAQSCSLFIVRMHHCLADGYSVMNLFKSIATGNTDATIRIPKPARKSLMEKILFPLKGLRDLILEDVEIKASVEPNAWKRPVAEMKKGFFTVWSKPGAVERIKGFKNRHGVSFQATVNAVIAGSIRRLMEAAGQSIPEHMYTLIPFPVMKHSEGLNVQTIPVVIKLPIAEQNPVTRAKSIQRCMEERAKSAGPLLGYSLGTTVGVFPLIAKVNPNTPVTLTLTSFPAFQEAVELNGHKCLSIGFAVGTHGGTTGATSSALTWFGNIVFALTIDKAVFPYESIINTWDEFVQAELDELDRAQDSTSLDFNSANV